MTQTLQIKRQVTVKTLVTDQFRQQAKEGLSEELKLIDVQSSQLEAQYQQALQQLEQIAQQGQNVQQQLEQLNREVQERRNQLTGLKMEVSHQLGNLDKIENGNYINTGMLENFVNLQVGDNIYEKMKGAVVLVKDGVIEAVQG